jgi:hypothetical protein
MVKRLLCEWTGPRLAAVLAFALCFAMPLVSWASTECTNPVTDETETYENVFTSETTEWNSAENWTLKESDKVPFVSGGNYDPALVDGKAVSTSTAIDGWTLRVGAYNGAAVTWNGGITKIQAGSAGCWLTADETSSITIASFAGNQLEGSDAYPFKLSSANAGGITWSAGLTSAGNTTLPFWYYLKGTGTVVYGGDITVANAQVIKQADITLSGTSQVTSKTLVTFGSGTTKTFTANATIKRLNSSGTDLNDDAHVATVTSGATTLTTSDAVGTCELVQTTTGIVLYWVDGDPASLTPTVYKPSININFTHSGSGLTTVTDVGLAGYEVPGTSWNNFAGANGTYSTVNAVDATGAASAMAGVSVAVSGSRGSYGCSGLTAASNPLQGYIDENAGNMTPTVTVTGIPYYKYRVLVYHSTDTGSVPFGYDTINGTNYTYENDALTEGTTAWGNSGADNSANAISEGGNVLLTGELSGSTLTVVGHREGGASNARGCIAAIQIIEVKPDAGANDLIIEVSGDTTNTVSAAKTLTGTVYLTGSGTLTLDGSAKISAGTINIGPLVTLNINTNRLDATTFTGAGRVVYDGVVPPTGKGWTESAWSGTVWIKNKSGITGNNNATTGVQPNSLGNANSKVKFSGVSGWIEAPVEFNPEIILENAGYDYALQLTNGNSPNSTAINRCTVVKKLSGSGTLCCGGTSAAVPTLKVYDASGFTGSINTVNADGATKTGLVVVFCDESTNLPDTLVNMFINSALKRTVYVASGKTVTLDSAATWTAETGFVVQGTLTANGTLASSHETKAVSGSGTVVFTGRGPTVTGTAWWKNADWTGTVQVKDVTNMVGDSRTGVWLKFNDYGNSGSVVEMNNVTGWLETGYTCTVPLKITGTLYLNNGGSGKASAFKVGTLLGSGTISGGGSAKTVVFNITDDWSGFTGAIGLNNKCIVFGSTIPDTQTEGTIYISEGAVVTNQNSASAAWWGVGGIKVDGELCAPNLDKFGGGTSIDTSTNGTLTLFSTEEETDVDYDRIKGSGTLRCVGAGKRVIAATNFPTTVAFVNEQEGGIVLSNSNASCEYSIGTLSGSGNFSLDKCMDATRLRIFQSKTTDFSGLFGEGLTVNVATNAAGGTLRLLTTQTNAVDLVVESGAEVCLAADEWTGNVTVAGTIGGNIETLDGNLNFTGSPTLKISEDSTMYVAGSITYQDLDENVLVDISELDLSDMNINTGEMVLFTKYVSNIDIDKFYLTNAIYKLESATDEYEPGLRLMLATGSLPDDEYGVVETQKIYNTTVTVQCGDTYYTQTGERIDEDDYVTYLLYSVPKGSTSITITYSAVSGYKLQLSDLSKVDSVEINSPEIAGLPWCLSDIDFEVIEAPSSGYEAWADANSVIGEWNEITSGIYNVFRYAFDIPSDNTLLITNITVDAANNIATIYTWSVEDYESVTNEFSLWVIASSEVDFTGTVTTNILDSSGKTLIEELLSPCRFFRLEADKK